MWRQNRVQHSGGVAMHQNIRVVVILIVVMVMIEMVVVMVVKEMVVG